MSEIPKTNSSDGDSQASSSNNTMLPPPNRPVVPSDRHMNDSTMPPPRYAARKKEQVPVVTKASRKTAVSPRHRFGLHDWKRLLAASKDLAQRRGAPIRRDITMEEVRQHNKNHDGWIVLRGRVYNIGPYLPYHPGGAGIFKSVLGKDATTLFDKYHRWVNIDGLVGPLLLGFVAMSKPAKSPFSVVPPKESHLTNAPRVSTQVASGSSLLADEEEDEEEEQILPPPP